MRSRSVLRLLAVAAAVFLLNGFVPSCKRHSHPESGKPSSSSPLASRQLILDRGLVTAAKERIAAGDSALQPALKRLLSEADRALTAGPFSVTYKKQTPPSGDKHDFMSLAPYWWPDPHSPNGLPYIRRDGVTNPERNQYDRIPFWQMDSAVSTLALAYFFTGNEAYAEHSVKLVKAWFLDDATCMNPHLKYGEAIRGICDGRAAGIIDGRPLFLVVDAIGLLADSKSWNERDQQRMVNWYDQYLSWLLESALGREEAQKENNHGTWYEVQVSTIALFVQKPDIARRFLEKIPARIASQIEPDGSQPLELERTRAFHYSSMNVDGLFNAARLGEQLGMDLWNFETRDGRSMRRALEYLADYATEKNPWPHAMIRGWETDQVLIASLLRRASLKYRQPAYDQMIKRLNRVDASTERFQLLYPLPE